MYKIEKFEGKNKEHYFRGVSSNGNIILSSEGYKNKKDRDTVADKITKAFNLYEYAVDTERIIPNKTFIGCAYFTEDGTCLSEDITGASCLYVNQRKCPLAEFVGEV